MKLPILCEELETLPQCLVFDKHLTDRKQIKRILTEALTPYFHQNQVHQIAHYLAIEIKVALCANVFCIDEELTMIFDEIKEALPLSAQKQKLIRTICQTILSCSELK